MILEYLSVIHEQYPNSVVKCTHLDKSKPSGDENELYTTYTLTVTVEPITHVIEPVK